MELTTSLVGQVMSVGVVAIIIVFQQEIRRFLLIIGNRYIKNSKFTIKRIFKIQQSMGDSGSTSIVDEIVRACEDMSETKTGALIVIGRMSSLNYFSDSGEIIDTKITSSLLKTIFFKNTPLHDGAVLIEKGRILAARCPLPTTERTNLPAQMGMRHRAAIGMSEHTDALVVVVSEETGRISVAEGGILKEGLNGTRLQNILLTEKIWEI